MGDNGKITKMNIAVNRKSNAFYPAESLGRRLRAQAVSKCESASGSEVFFE